MKEFDIGLLYRFKDYFG